MQTRCRNKGFSLNSDITKKQVVQHLDEILVVWVV